MEKEKLSPLVVKAVEFAVKHHKDAVRKGTRIPYLAHLFNVAAILADAGCDDEVVAAGLLHDVVEDTDINLEDVQNEFGDRIARIVKACTENYKLEKKDFNAKETWRERKEHTIYEVIPRATADEILVMLADKLDNIKSIYNDYLALKDDLWNRFNAGKAEQNWYIQALLEAIKAKNVRDEKVSSLYSKIQDIHDKLFAENPECGL